MHPVGCKVFKRLISNHLLFHFGQLVTIGFGFVARSSVSKSISKGASRYFAALQMLILEDDQTASITRIIRASSV